jgi:hypothetical protein
MNLQEQDTLFSSLDCAIETLERNRLPDPRFVAAFDHVKQARAMLVRVMRESAAGSPPADLRAAA